MISPDELRKQVPHPSEIYAQLDARIIGQVSAKKAISIFAMQHYIGMMSGSNELELSGTFTKKNLLLIGPTGSGKTALIKVLQELIHCPITTYDATSLTANGYYGSGVSDIIIKHVKNCNTYVEQHYEEYRQNCLTDGIYNHQSKEDYFKFIVEHGIIFLDEIDKARRGSASGPREIGYGQNVQQELLPFLGDTVISLMEEEYSRKLSGTIRWALADCVNTKDIMFICGGAFSGIEEVIAMRLNKTNSIGFNGDISNKEQKNKDIMISKVTTQDLINYGFIPEFMGRLTGRAVLSKLTTKELIDIISEVDDSILAYYKNLFSTFGKDLIITDKALEIIAKRAKELDTGARGLRRIFEILLEDEVFNLPEKDIEGIVTITEQIATERLKNYAN